ncbi:MAG: V-type ATPase 116kDa subunit family protein [Candidatus Helarchaeota archaeon]
MTVIMKKVITVFNKRLLDDVVLEVGALGICQLTRVRKDLTVKDPDTMMLDEFNSVNTHILRLLEKFDMRDINIEDGQEQIEDISFKKEDLVNFLTRVKEKVDEIDKELQDLEEAEILIEKEVSNQIKIEIDTDQVVIHNIEEIEKRKEEFIESVNKLAKKYYLELKAFNKMLNDIIHFLDASLKSGGNQFIAIMECWIPKKEINKYEQVIKKVTNNHYQMIVLSKEQLGNETIPTVLKHSNLVKPFETITKLYGVPNANEVDPSFMLTISFPLMFGFMFGDIGQGICLAIAAGILALKTKRTIAKILCYCGIGGVFGGFLYGEFFGFETEVIFGLPPLIKFLFNPLTMLQLFPEYQFGGLANNLIFLIKFSLFVGFIILSLGYTLQFINNYKSSAKIDAWLVSLPSLLFVIGFSIMFFNYGVQFTTWMIPQITFFFLPPILLILIPLLILLLGKPIAAAFKVTQELRRESFKKIISESILHVWETFLSFLSNIVSFFRIFALLLIHFGFNHVVIIIAFMFITNPFIFIPILVVGNILVIMLEAFLVSIHTLRLHFYEWFSKFYKGQGTEYHPFILKISKKNS